jgi:UDP-N-acetylglucosamine--N-acetylmuramyl-(pentapeptide) pyrophosphoryl-undecaprenol N-acetylglucosamine transferase
MSHIKRVLMMAGGTGGHIFPGLALADYFKEQGSIVHWLGTAHGLEASLVPARQYPLHTITINGLRGKGFKSLIKMPLTLIRAIYQANKIIKSVKPDIVIGMGGFASGPGGMASIMQGIPLFIHEQNAKAGLTNRLLKPFARKVFAGFPQSFKACKKVIYVGNPVRKEINQLPPLADRLTMPHQPLHLLILGGSLGALALNQLVPQAIALLAKPLRPMIYHQAGEKHLAKTKANYQALALEARVESFISAMDEAYCWADMVLCRAGALTVAELCAIGRGAILVPYPHAVDDHQTENARFMQQQQAALLMPQLSLSAESLAQQLTVMLEKPAMCVAMAEASYQLRKLHVVETIYDLVLKETNA